MQDKKRISFQVSPLIQRALPNYMKAAGVSTRGEFFRAAANRFLDRKGQEPLTTETCIISDNSAALVALQDPADVKNPILQVTMEFRGAALHLADALNTKSGSRGHDWLQVSLFDYMEELDHTRSKTAVREDVRAATTRRPALI